MAYKSGYYAKVVEAGKDSYFMDVYISDLGSLYVYVWPGYDVTKRHYFKAEKDELYKFLEDVAVSGESLPEYSWVWNKEKHGSDRVVKEGRTFIVYKGDYK